MKNNETMDVSGPMPGESQSGTAGDAPGVIIFPPVLCVSALLLGITFQYLWPLHLGLARTLPIVGAILVAMSGIIVLGAFRSMRCAETNVHPGKPTTAIVSAGPYRFTRNPIYLGNTMLYAGLAVMFNAVWPLLTLAPFFLLLHWGVVLREERYLEAKFGDAYLSYKARVRRWL